MRNGISFYPSLNFYRACDFKTFIAKIGVNIHLPVAAEYKMSMLAIKQSRSTEK